MANCSGKVNYRLQENGWKGPSYLGESSLSCRCGAFSQLLTLPTAAAWVTLVVATRIHKNHACKGGMLAAICRILKQKDIRHGSARLLKGYSVLYIYIYIYLCTVDMYRIMYASRMYHSCV